MGNYSESTQAILKWFEQIAKIPRRSKHEAQIRAWILHWSEQHGFTSRVDSIGNVLVEVPGTEGYEQSPTVVLQGHLDMVCEKTPDSTHDFSKDPIELVYGEDGWLRANQTTLGADNGIAIAMAMAVAVHKTWFFLVDLLQALR